MVSGTTRGRGSRLRVCERPAAGAGARRTGGAGAVGRRCSSWSTPAFRCRCAGTGPVPVIRASAGGQDRPRCRAGRLGRGERPGPAAVDQPGGRRGRLGEARRGAGDRGRATRGPGRRSAARAGAAARRRPARQRAQASAGRPGVGGASQATARCGRSCKTESTSGVRIAPGPDLDEDARPVAVHRLDHLGEPDRAGEVIAQPRGDGRALGRIGGGVDVGVDRPVRRLAEPLAGQPGERLPRPATIGVWKAPETGSTPGADAPRGASSTTRSTAADGPAMTVCRGPFQFAARTPAPRGSRPSTCVRTGQDGRHRAGGSPAGLDHEPAPRRRQLGQLAGVQHARGVEGRPARRSCARRPARARAQARQAAAASRRRPRRRPAGPRRSRQRPPRLAPRASSSKAGGGKTSGPERGPPPAAHGAVEFLERPADLGERHGQLAQHAGRLRALAREEERDPRAGPRRLRREEDPPRVVELGPPLRDRIAASRSFSRRSSSELGDDRQGRATPRSAPALRAPISVCDRSRSAGRAPASSDPARRSIGCDQAGRPVGLADQELRRPVGQGRRGAGLVLRS